MFSFPFTVEATEPFDNWSMGTELEFGELADLAGQTWEAEIEKISNLSQGDNGNWAFATQVWSGNEIDIQQHGINNGTSVAQWGCENYSRVQQVGEGNLSKLKQIGSNNQAFVDQLGNGNALILYQIGYGNRAEITQTAN